MRKTALVCFALGATVGSALDAIHTHSGTTVYASEIGLKMAWWTPPLFGLAGLGTGIGYPLAERRLKQSIPSSTWRSALAAFVLFVGLYFVSGYMPASNAMKLGVLAIGACALLGFFARTRIALGLSVLAAIVGPLVEITLISQGAFRHLQPDVLGIPIWLPALYASGSLAFGVVGHRLHATISERGASNVVAAAVTPS